MFSSTTVHQRRVVAVLLKAAIACLAILFCQNEVSLASATQDNSAVAIYRAAIEARLQSLQDLSATLNEVTTYTPEERLVKQLLARTPNIIVNRGIVTSNESFSYREGRFYFSQELTPRQLEQDGIEHVLAMKCSIRTWSGDRAELYQIDNTSRYGSGTIKGDFLVTDDCMLDAALGIRAYRSQQFLTLADIKSGLVRIENPRRIIFELHDGGNRVHQWIFDPESNYTLIQYNIFTAAKVPLDVFECSDMVSVGGIQVPSHIVHRLGYNLPNGKYYISLTNDLVNIRYEIPAEAKASRFMILWPKGTAVYDDRRQAQLGPLPETRILDEKYIHDLLQKRQDDAAAAHMEAARRIQQILGSSSTEPTN